MTNTINRDPISTITNHVDHHHDNDSSVTSMTKVTKEGRAADGQSAARAIYG
jgi:hypothetical protein